MAELRIFYDREGQTLTVWFAAPRDETVCDQVGGEVVLMKDRSGRVIGFEKLNFSLPETESLTVAVEPATLEKNLKLCAPNRLSRPEAAEATARIS